MPLGLSSLGVALGVNLLLGSIALARGAVSRSGYVGGVLVGSWILFFGGAGAYSVLLLFFVLGSGATRLGYRRKASRGLAQEEGGRRGSRHALANCGTGLALSTLLPFVDSPLVGIGIVAAFATASSDTLGSEIGQLYGRRTVLPTTLRPVPPGTEGAVSLEGTAAGVLGSGLLALTGGLMELHPLSLLWVPVVGAFAGTTVESLVGARFGSRVPLSNELMNFMNTVVGAVSAMLLGWALV